MVVLDCLILGDMLDDLIIESRQSTDFELDTFSDRFEDMDDVEQCAILLDNSYEPIFAKGNHMTCSTIDTIAFRDEYSLDEDAIDDEAVIEGKIETVGFKVGKIRRIDRGDVVVGFEFDNSDYFNEVNDYLNVAYFQFITGDEVLPVAAGAIKHLLGIIEYFNLATPSELKLLNDRGTVLLTF